MSTGRPSPRLPVDLRLRRRLWAERLPAHRRGSAACSPLIRPEWAGSAGRRR